jgi:hypothetical protein
VDEMLREDLTALLLPARMAFQDLLGIVGFG